MFDPTRFKAVGALGVYHSGYGSGGTGNAFWVNGFECMERMTRGHATHRSGRQRRERQVKREDGKWNGDPDNGGGQLQTVV